MQGYKGIEEGQLERDTSGSKCVGGSVGNIKEAIRGGLNSSTQRSSGNQRDRNSWVVVGKNWDNGVNWDESDGKRERRRRRRRRVRIRNIGELEQRRMVGVE